MQKVINDFYVKYLGQVEQYQSQGRYPMNGPVEIRVQALTTSKMPKSTERLLLNSQRFGRVLTDRNGMPRFGWISYPSRVLPSPISSIAKWSSGCSPNYSGNYADVRVKWSKGWGYTIDAPWTSQTTIKRRIPESLTTGQATEKGFASAVDQLNQLDPFRIYSSPLLDAVFPAKSNTGGSFS